MVNRLFKISAQRSFGQVKTVNRQQLMVIRLCAESQQQVVFNTNYKMAQSNSNKEKCKVVFSFKKERERRGEESGRKERRVY